MMDKITTVITVAIVVLVLLMLPWYVEQLLLAVQAARELSIYPG